MIYLLKLKEITDKMTANIKELKTIRRNADEPMNGTLANHIVDIENSIERFETAIELKALKEKIHLNVPVTEQSQVALMEPLRQTLKEEVYLQQNQIHMCKK